jgi:hypothetical protein
MLNAVSLVRVWSYSAKQGQSAVELRNGEDFCVDLSVKSFKNCSIEKK